MIQIEVKGVATLMAKLDRIRAGLSSTEVGKVYLALANEQANLIKSGTLAGRDISGKAFTRLKSRVGQPLADTGKMLAAVHPMGLGPAGAAVVIGNTIEAKKGAYHQWGTGIYGPSGQRIKAKGRALGPIKMRVNNSSVKTGRSGTKTGGKYFFASVAGVPARPWFGFRPGDVEKLTEKAKVYIETVLKKKAS